MLNEWFHDSNQSEWILIFQKIGKEITIPSSINSKTLLSSFTSRFTAAFTSSSSSTKWILKDVSGYALPGEVLAILGLSGSGKTSLLNILGGRDVMGLNHEGQVFIRDKPIDNVLRRRIAFIHQQDCFLPSEYLTVREQLMFIASCRSGDKYSTSEVTSHVDKIMKQMRLFSVADVPICKLSGGEAKRVSIGCELLTRPKILLIDEGTSSLDSASMKSFITLVKRIARESKIPVVLSIHQPNAKTFFSFDRTLLLLAGRSVFFGSPQRCQEYFTQNALFSSFADSLHSPPSSRSSNSIGRLSSTLSPRSNIHHNFAEDIIEFLSYQQRLGDKTDPRKIPMNCESVCNFGQNNENDKSRFITSVANLVEQWKLFGEPELKEEIQEVNLTINSTELYSQVSSLSSDSHMCSIFHYLFAYSTLSPNSPGNDSPGGIVDTDRSRRYMLPLARHSLSSTHYLLTRLREIKKKSDTCLQTWWWRPMVAICYRSWQASDAAIISTTKLNYTIITALLIGASWFQLSMTENEVVDICSLLTFIIGYFFFSGMKSGVLDFVAERHVYRKERKAGTYGLLSFVAGRSFSTLPIRVVLPAIFLCIVYPLSISKLRFETFVKIFCITILSGILGESIGLFLAALALSQDATTNIGIIICLGSFVLGGFFIQNYPDWLESIAALLPFRQLFALAVIAQFSGEKSLECTGGLHVGACINQATVSISVVLQRILHEEPKLYNNLSLVLIYVLCFRVATCLSLKFIDEKVTSRH